MMAAVRPDWHPGTLPGNVVCDPTAYVGTSYSFGRFRSAEPVGLVVGRGASICDLTILDVGPRGRVVIGEYALLNSPMIVCDGAVTIGDHVLIGWDAVLMDTYRRDGDARPIAIGRNAWIGFAACVLPGVRIGADAVVAARAVVVDDVPPGAVVAGNPARVVRYRPA